MFELNTRQAEGLLHMTVSWLQPVDCLTFVQAICHFFKHFQTLWRFSNASISVYMFYDVTISQRCLNKTLKVLWYIGLTGASSAMQLQI